ncbi:phosphotransferase family protein [Halalkalirubrum salinum]|uniref:phosphotransferase family protein n=1 Tax=Halalkalirubrum salinum TaxID=2563889 RepID=UPI001485A881|nr:phosphotransferase [Halalkalirubrum salinum]
MTETQRSDLNCLLNTIGPDATIESVKRPEQGNHKDTTVVSLSSGQTVVVQASPAGTDGQNDLKTEGALMRAIAAQTTVPVPEVIAAPTIDTRQYLVTEYIPGDDLHKRFVSIPEATRRSIARSVGEILASLHEVFVFDRCGSLTTSDASEIRVQNGDVPARWLSAHAIAGIDRLPAQFDDLADRARDAVEHGRPTSDAIRLYPWDLRPGNAIVRDGEIVAVLDWGGPIAAPVGLSIAKTEHMVARWYGGNIDGLTVAFRDGYRSVRGYVRPTQAERIAAVAHAAVDSKGVVTRPGYPERTGDRAIEFHRASLFDALSSP